jgi:hypothetical protein
LKKSQAVATVGAHVLLLRIDNMEAMQLEAIPAMARRRALCMMKNCVKEIDQILE